MSVWRRWTPEAVKRAAVDQLAQNAEIVGKFVETEARSRLLAIRKPEWGQKYRALVVARRLTYEVERDPKGVTIRVGVRKGEKGRWYGYYIEFGSRTAPAQPFLRPAVYGNAREILALLRGR